MSYGTTNINGTTYTLYGFPGSTLVDELNRLANGGTYPALTAYLAEDGAANKWAGTTGLTLVQALNYKASITDPSLMKSLNRWANSYAFSQNDPSKFVEAVTALRTVAS